MNDTVKWLIGVIVTIVVAAAIGGATFYNWQGNISAKVEGLQSDVAELKIEVKDAEERLRVNEISSEKAIAAIENLVKSTDKLNTTVSTLVIEVVKLGEESKKGS